MEGDYTITIVVAFVGFMALAALLLIPVWRFLRREEESAKQWTPGRTPQKAEERTNGARDEREATGQTGG